MLSTFSSWVKTIPYTVNVTWLLGFILELSKWIEQEGDWEGGEEAIYRS